ncbi:MAG: hypothetical protein SGPRY_013778, partial [Prymnesium sp.]
NSSVYQLKNGKYIDATFPYKTGSTDWLRLLVLHLSGTLVKNPHSPSWRHTLQHAHVPRYIAVNENPTCVDVVSFIIVRSPYERMLSAYMDKVVSAGQLNLAPRGMKRNGTFADFVTLALKEQKVHSLLGALHYAPITKYWSHLCGNDCWLNLPRSMRILKLEEMSSWYADVIKILGWEEAFGMGTFTSRGTKT